MKGAKKRKTENLGKIKLLAVPNHKYTSAKNLGRENLNFKGYEKKKDGPITNFCMWVLKNM